MTVSGPQLMNKQREKPSLPATDSELRPGDFPLGSIESRAAARAKLERIKVNPGDTLHIIVERIGGDGKTPLPPPERIEWEGGVTVIEHVPSRGAPLDLRGNR
jgi:hypothetical protein